MKSKLLLLAAVLSVGMETIGQTNTFPNNGNVGIGTVSPNTSSMLEVKSTTKGLLIPRMTKGQRDAIGSPATGLMIYQTNNTPGFYYYSGKAWTALSVTGANTSLSNLVGVKVNRNFLPDSAGTRNIGSATLPWLNGNFSGTLRAGISSVDTGVNGSGFDIGVYGAGSNGYGMYGVGVLAGVYGNGNYGVYGTGKTGVHGNGSSYGLYGESDETGVLGSGTTYGVYGTGKYGVYGSGSYYGLYGISTTGNAINAESTNGYGVYATSGYAAIVGVGGTYGVYGKGSYGLYGVSIDGTGMYAESTNGYGADIYSVDNQALYAYNANNISYYAGFFVGDVYSSTGVYASSDQKLKQNIKDVTSAMSIINQLKPKNYDFRHDGSFGLMNLPQGNHYGLIAQDVEKVLPNLVKNSKFDPPVIPKSGEKQPDENAKKADPIDFKALNYTELIPIMIKGMQEQDAKIEALTQLVNKLQGQLASSGSQNINDAPAKLTTASLDQNIPNPLTNSTSIRYNIPAGSSNAQLIVSDNAGNPVKQIQLNNKGNGVVNIETSGFNTGTYSYTLFVDGKMIETKKMIITR